LSRGLYALQLQRWFRHGLGPDMLLLPYPELEWNPQQVYRQVLEFVGMPHHALSKDMLLKKYNYNEFITEPMSNSTRLRLAAFFEESRVELMNLLQEHDKILDHDWDALWD
jgi:Sulfotransferase domain